MNSQRLAYTSFAVAVLVGCGGGQSKTHDAGQPDVLGRADVPAYSDLAADLATLADLVTGADTADGEDPRRDVTAPADTSAAAGDATEARVEAPVLPVDGAAGEAAGAEPTRDGPPRDVAAGEAMPDVTDAATIEVGGDERLPTDQSGTDQAAGGDTDPETEELRALCLATGGMVVTIPCCSGTAPFPTTCPYLNRCGCAPEYLVPKEICECPADSCFELWPRVGCQ